jgi:hypothetical protein
MTACIGLIDAATQARAGDSDAGEGGWRFGMVISISLYLVMDYKRV